MRVACLKNSKITYTDARPICLAGEWYAVRAGFVWECNGVSLSFECEDEADAKAWVALAMKREGVTAGGAQMGADVQGGAGLEAAGSRPNGEVSQQHQNGESDGISHSRAQRQYPHESEYGGGKDYVSAPYTGGKSLLAPEVRPTALHVRSLLPECTSLRATRRGLGFAGGVGKG
jgi:hypothetical protein